MAKIAQWREKKIVRVNEKKFWMKWMEIAQWRERKILHVNEKEFLMKMDGNSPMERKKKFLCE
jgi:hypothetical protein